MRVAVATIIALLWAIAAVQLLAEYAPEPPYDAGTTHGAPAEVTTMMSDIFVDFRKQADSIGREAYAKYRQG